ncbi:hypothetical protein VC83_00020 [Pseudogymnoascus destructans]|uniref:Uncharacterized protein n=1 Tax=Pseudogymnoascus destructans TaxID=655981 RepID=A0A177AMH1_9PEZI|nr:uncharacterized protein VC83_00020 [Pseudogymnoascus destructans]OAF63269.1 hypothetical protein VC83_00020 [Pseudogymnoascus destructans]
MSSATFKPLAEILRIEESPIVPHFTTSDAFDLGLLLQTRLADASKPALISIVEPSGLATPLSPT